MKTFKVFYIYTVQAETKTEALRSVEVSRGSSDPLRFLTVHFAKEEGAQGLLSMVVRQIFG